MPTDARPVVLLGPQRHNPSLIEAIDALGIRGPIAAITAGWEEREDEDDELAAHLRGRAVNLRVFARVDVIYQRDPELHRALLRRYETIRKLRDLYRLRLDHALATVRELAETHAAPALLEPEIEHALAVVRDLDRHYLGRVAEIHARFLRRWSPAERDLVARQREEVAAVLRNVEALCVAGGHVGVLLNRMRLLGLPELAGDLPIVAWSGGAMVLGERVVLFHDGPPQGAGNAEVFEPGLGAYRGVVPLPHARRRLRLDDPVRMALFARRFAPDRCVAMLAGSSLARANGAWTANAHAPTLEAGPLGRNAR